MTAAISALLMVPAAAAAAPVAQFDAEAPIVDDGGASGLSINCTGSCMVTFRSTSYDLDGDPHTERWTLDCPAFGDLSHRLDWQDGPPPCSPDDATGPTVTRTYAHSGEVRANPLAAETHLVALEVRTADGQVDYARAVVHVHPQEKSAPLDLIVPKRFDSRDLLAIRSPKPDLHITWSNFRMTGTPVRVRCPARGPLAGLRCFRVPFAPRGHLDFFVIAWKFSQGQGDMLRESAFYTGSLFRGLTTRLTTERRGGSCRLTAALYGRAGTGSYSYHAWLDLRTENKRQVANQVVKRKVARFDPPPGESLRGGFTLGTTSLRINRPRARRLGSEPLDLRITQTAIGGGMRQTTTRTARVAARPCSARLVDRKLSPCRRAKRRVDRAKRRLTRVRTRLRRSSDPGERRRLRRLADQRKRLAQRARRRAHRSCRKA